MWYFSMLESETCGIFKCWSLRHVVFFMLESGTCGISQRLISLSYVFQSFK